MALVILYLTSTLKSSGVTVTSLPGPILEWLRYVQDYFDKYGFSVNASRIPELLELTGKNPEKIENMKPDIFMRVGPETVWEDVERVKKIVKLYQLEIYGKPGRRSREWQTYERQMFMHQRVIKDGIEAKDALDEWLDQDEDRQLNPPDEATVRDDIKKIEALIRELELRFGT